MRSSTFCSAFSAISSAFFGSNHVDCDLCEITNHRFDISPDVSNFGEL